MSNATEQEKLIRRGAVAPSPYTRVPGAKAHLVAASIVRDKSRTYLNRNRNRNDYSKSEKQIPCGGDNKKGDNKKGGNKKGDSNCFSSHGF